VALEPGNARLRMGLSRLAMINGKYDVAAKQLETALQNGHIDRYSEIRTRMMLAQVYRRSQQYDKAVGEYMCLLKKEQRPEVKCALLFSLANLYKRANKKDLARETYQKILEITKKERVHASQFIHSRATFRMRRLVRTHHPVEKQNPKKEKGMQVEEHPDVAAFRAKVANLKDMDLYSAPEVHEMLLKMLDATQ